MRHIDTSSSMSAIRYAPGTSTMATSRPSCASMVAVINTDSSATVGDVASDFVGPSLCFLPSANDLPLMEPSRFSFVNTSGKAGAQIPHLPLGDDSSPRGR
jgi:hypothetical protein